VNPPGSGSGSLNPPGGIYDAGTVVTLTANPSSGWEFDHWSGDLSGTSNPATITMDKNKSVTANFIQHIVTITSGPTANPTTIDSGGTTNLSVTATDSLGHSINYSWTVSGDDIYRLEGNVGIGTTEPGANLEVRNSEYGIVVSDPVVIANRLYLCGNSGDVSVGKNLRTKFNEWSNADIAAPSTGMVMDKYSDISFWNRAADAPEGLGTTKLTILNNGNIGIGTVNPQSKLAVNGTITAKEVIVTLDGWADYVFEDDYKLMPIDELEQSIKKNKHLPGIPSAESVAENGVSLGEMQAKLLQKIEELTLYMIEQNKKIEKKMKSLKIVSLR